jgi:hypothetical protein
MIAAVVAAAFVLVGGGAYAVWRAQDASSPKPPAPSVTAGGGSSVGAGSVEPSATSSPSSGPSAEATAALQSCVTQVRAQESLAKAVGSAAANWKTHTDAQRRLEDGTYTAAQTAAAWARSKAKGPSDVKAYATANAGLKQAGTGCADVGSKTAGSELESQATACAKRSELLGAVASVGTKVQSQWSAHITMMANKAHADRAAYHQRWLKMVKDAGPTLAEFDDAADAAAKAPECSA